MKKRGRDRRVDRGGAVVEEVAGEKIVVRGMKVEKDCLEDFLSIRSEASLRRLQTKKISSSRRTTR